MAFHCVFIEYPMFYIGCVTFSVWIVLGAEISDLQIRVVLGFGHPSKTPPLFVIIGYKPDQTLTTEHIPRHLNPNWMLKFSSKQHQLVLECTFNVYWRVFSSSGCGFKLFLWSTWPARIRPTHDTANANPSFWMIKPPNSYVLYV